MSDELKQGEMIPIRDGRGNFLTIGSEVVYAGVKNHNFLIGRVVGFDPGGISVIESGDNNKPKQTVAKLRIVFDLIVAVSPQAPIVQDMFRIINPDAETVLAKLLDDDKVPRIVKPS